MGDPAAAVVGRLSGGDAGGPWERTFYDGTDGAGRPFGVIEDRREIASFRCIGCGLRRSPPETATVRVSEVWVNGERQDDERECRCDPLEQAGCTPFRADAAEGENDGRREAFADPNPVAAS